LAVKNYSKARPGRKKKSAGGSDGLRPPSRRDIIPRQEEEGGRKGRLPSKMTAIVRRGGREKNSTKNEKNQTKA